MMVIKLNMILITSPELADFRRRLKNLETKVCLLSRPELVLIRERTGRCCFRHFIDHGAIILLLYLHCVSSHRLMNMLRIYSRSCKSSAATELTFSADLELTVSLLVQIDKLVMLIESPVFLSKSSLCLPRG